MNAPPNVVTIDIQAELFGFLGCRITAQANARTRGDWLNAKAVPRGDRPEGEIVSARLAECYRSDDRAMRDRYDDLVVKVTAYGERWRDKHGENATFEDRHAGDMIVVLAQASTFLCPIPPSG